MSWIGSFLCWSYKREVYEAVHDFRTDVFKLALYGPDADLKPDTTGYVTAGELPSLNGYAAGGKEVAAVPRLLTSTGIVEIEDVTWTDATFSARGAMLYNSSKPGWPAVFVLDFGETRIPNAGTFTVQFPPADANNAILRTP